jgi:hypothetical protein
LAPSYFTTRELGYAVCRTPPPELPGSPPGVHRGHPIRRMSACRAL